MSLDEGTDSLLNFFYIDICIHTGTVRADVNNSQRWLGEQGFLASQKLFFTRHRNDCIDVISLCQLQGKSPARNNGNLAAIFPCKVNQFPHLAVSTSPAIIDIFYNVAVAFAVLNAVRQQQEQPFRTTTLPAQPVYKID
jgi:hypothetical protein